MKACLSFNFEREAHLLAISKTKSTIGIILGEVKFLWSLKTQGGGLRFGSMPFRVEPNTDNGCIHAGSGCP